MLQDGYDIRLVGPPSYTKIAARVQTKQQGQRWLPGAETRGRRAGKTGYIYEHRKGPREAGPFRLRLS